MSSDPHTYWNAASWQPKVLLTQSAGRFEPYRAPHYRTGLFGAPLTDVLSWGHCLTLHCFAVFRCNGESRLVSIDRWICDMREGDTPNRPATSFKCKILMCPGAQSRFIKRSTIRQRFRSLCNKRRENGMTGKSTSKACEFFKIRNRSLK